MSNEIDAFRQLPEKFYYATAERSFASNRQIMAQTPWFDRHFDFSIPADALPALRDRLRSTPARLVEAFRGRCPNPRTRRPDGKWSAQEHAGHLADLEPLWLARLNDFIVGTPRLTPADLTNRKTDEAHHNARQLSQILTEFAAAREELLARLDSLPASAFAHAIVHPRLEVPMRLLDHLYFVAEHDDHHLARIAELFE